MWFRNLGKRIHIIYKNVSATESQAKKILDTASRLLETDLNNMLKIRS